jgi:hypothetical protein
VAAGERLQRDLAGAPGVASVVVRPYAAGRYGDLEWPCVVVHVRDTLGRGVDGVFMVDAAGERSFAPAEAQLVDVAGVVQDDLTQTEGAPWPPGERGAPLLPGLVGGEAWWLDARDDTPVWRVGQLGGGRSQRRALRRHVPRPS